MQIKRFDYFGETEHRRPGVQKVAQGVSAHFCLAKLPQLPYGVKKNTFSCPPSFPVKNEKKISFLSKFDRAFIKLEKFYKQVLTWSLNHRWKVLLLSFLIVLSSGFLFWQKSFFDF